MLQRCLCRRAGTQAHWASSSGLAAAIQGAHAAAHASSSPCTPIPAHPSRTSGAPAGGLPLPLVDEITSTSSAYVKHCVRLRESAKYRQEQQRLLVVGGALLQELADAHQDELPARVLFVQHIPGSKANTHSAASIIHGIAPQRTITVTEAVLRKLTGLNSVDSIGAVAELDMPQWAQLLPGSHPYNATTENSIDVSAAGPASAGSAQSWQPAAEHNAEAGTDRDSPDALHQQQQHQQQWQQQPQEQHHRPYAEAGEQDRVPVLRRLLALDGVQDPGNMGTLLRSALAFGWDAAWLLPGCCDPFNDKALRASRGAALRLPLASGSWEQLREVAAVRQLVLLAAEPEEEGVNASSSSSSNGDRSNANRSNRDFADTGCTAASSSASGQHAVCLVLGSEGQGLSREALECCQAVAIPMVPGQMESLNVGIAGGILMFVLSNGLPRLLRRLDRVQPAS